MNTLTYTHLLCNIYFLFNMCIACSVIPSAASIKGSAKVGWAWIIKLRSSAVAPDSIAITASEISDDTSGPTFCTPKTLLESFSAITCTNPSALEIDKALPFAWNENRLYKLNLIFIPTATEKHYAFRGLELSP